MAGRLAEMIVQYGGTFVGTNPEHSFVTTRSPLRGGADPASAEAVVMPVASRSNAIIPATLLLVLK
jgi:hypothetical protein